MRRALIALFALLLAMPARAEVSEVRLSKQYGLPYLPFMVMEHFQMLEKQAAKQGIALKVSWTTLSNSTAMMEAIISGQMDFIAPGLPTLATMWDKIAGDPSRVAFLRGRGRPPHQRRADGLEEVL
jgi:NitT/TauT family transport system substrate-binding protein